MKIAQLFLLILAFFLIKPAQADLLIEPLIGFNMAGKIEFEGDKSAGEPNKSHTGGMGLGYGGRLGYQNYGFQLGIDYLHSSLDMDDKYFKKNVEMGEWAGFVGFKFPVLFKVYAAYIFSATGDSTNEDSDKIALSKGKGAKFGVGTTILPFLDINLEYRRGSFSEIKIDGDKSEFDTNYSAYLLSISLPFTI